jgi:hypothetical protein
MQAAPAERWRAIDGDGTVLAEAWLTVDTECALLHGMGGSQWSARWLVHAAIVERLCESSCRFLVTNSYDVPLLTQGQQHFQHLLGYSVARLCPRPARFRRSRKRAPLAVIALASVAAIVGGQLLASPFEVAGHRALVWLTALVAIRIATGRAGWATLVGGLAGSAIAVLAPGSPLVIPLAYFLCGVALDLELALVPRLARSAGAISLAGITVIFVTLIAPKFPTVGHESAGAAWTLKPTLAAIAFGGLSAVLGYRLGRTLRHESSTSSPRREGQGRAVRA